MNLMLISNRHQEQTLEEFTKAWENAGYTLEPLQKTVIQMRKGLEFVKTTDFDCPNHYAKLMFQQGKLQAYNEILALMPESLKV